MSYGLASISHVAETARHQGNDLWQTSVGTRVEAASELHLPFETGAKIPSWLCGGTIARSMDPGKSFSEILVSLLDMEDLLHLHYIGKNETDSVLFVVVEPPYNAIAFRLHTPMPNTEKLVL